MVKSVEDILSLKSSWNIQVKDECVGSAAYKKNLG